MRKFTKIIIATLLIITLTLSYTVVVFAEQLAKPDGEMLGADGGTPPDKPDGNGGGPGGDNNTNISHTGATEISSNKINSGISYSSTTGSQNALLVTGGTSTIMDPTITKSGDSDGDSADFYGTNAAVLVKEGTLNIKGGTVTTSGSHANGVFAYSNGTINISDATIQTTSNNSGAVMVTGGGKLTADNVTAETKGNSSAPIRSDRGGGTLTVNGGKYTANGIGSPAIYSTANIIVNNSNLISTSSEGAVVEGANSIVLNNTKLTDTNTSLNGNSETYKNIFLYQSMSGDADEGTASFTATDSEITTNKGDTIFVTNTTATLSLTGNTFINNDKDGAFLRIQTGKWGTSGKNGGTVTLNSTNQSISGNIYVDNISSLSMKLTDGSSYSGTINGSDTAKLLSIDLDSSSNLTLTGDTYVTSLTNEVSDNSNINLNGHTLYVNGNAITSTNYSGDSQENEPDEIISKAEEDSKNPKKYVKNFAIFIIGIILILLIVRFGIKSKNK